jgi:hypothetical protein
VAPVRYTICPGYDFGILVGHCAEALDTCSATSRLAMRTTGRLTGRSSTYMREGRPSFQASWGRQGLAIPLHVSRSQGSGTHAEVDDVPGWPSEGTSFIKLSMVIRWPRSRWTGICGNPACWSKRLYRSRQYRKVPISAIAARTIGLIILSNKCDIVEGAGRRKGGTIKGARGRCRREVQLQIT